MWGDSVTYCLCSRDNEECDYCSGHALECTCYRCYQMKENYYDNTKTEFDYDYPNMEEGWCPYCNDDCLDDYNDRNQAAVIIQRAWLKCRWDPKYKMCATVQWRNYNDIK